MADTALDLITNALLDLGVLADEETPTASQAAGGLRKLNNMIDAWAIENLLVYASIPSVFPLIANQGTYTLGTGGNFNMPRPATVQSAYLRDTSQNFDFPLYMYSASEYASIADKFMPSQMPQGVYLDNNFPLINVYLVSVPSTSQYSLVLWTNKLITNLALNDVISLPPGYKRALEFNLVMELADSYGIDPAASTIQLAVQSKADLKVHNLQINELSLPMSRGFYNQYTGEMNG